MDLESCRARRRRLTETIALRRHSEFSARNRGETYGHNPHWWAKRGTLSCSCSKRRRNRPRISSGMCDIGARNRIYRLRALTRELELLVCRTDIDLDGDAVALMSNVRVVNDLW